MPEVNRIGFTELGGSDGSKDNLQGIKKVNIVLVHGLRGHPLETWTSSHKADNERAVGASGRRQYLRSIFKSSAPPPESNSTQDGTSTRQRQLFWPHDYLAKDIPQARVWTYGYNADVIGGLFQANNKNNVSGHGRDLKVRLERDIDNEDPLIFVAHSLGGIIVKDALRRSEACRQRTRLVIFLGTPHRGSPWASWGEIASNLARVALQDSHKKIVETLEVDSEVLDNIHEQFIEVLPNHIYIHSFQEGRGISGVKGLHEKVVSDFSSKLGLPGIEIVESIDANHMQMARCKDRLDESYRAIAGVLKQFLKRGSSGADLPIRSVIKMQREATPSVQQEADTSCATTSYCNIPPRNRRFIGRMEKLEELEEKLILSNDCQKLALVGLGGVGKTQVALKLAYTIKERWPEYSIFWVPAVSVESFEQGYRDIASHCSVALNPMEEDVKDSVRRYLNSSSAGKWLLIVDNADDEEILFGAPNGSRGVTDHLPESEIGLTLFTTRHRQIAVSLAVNEVVEIEKMNDEEAEIFLKKSLIRKQSLQDRAVTAELLTELTHLPLAIAQAAAYLDTMQISIQEYLSLLRNTEQDTISLLSREFRDETRYERSEHIKNAVATTWLVSFNHIRRSDPIAADLLSFISCIEYKAIPRSILPSVEPAERMVHAIGTLRSYAFLVPWGDGESYDMHRLVHLATKVWLGEHSATENLNEQVATHLAEIFPSDDYENRAVWREYFPHVFRFLGNSKMLDIEARYGLCMAIGRCLQQDGRVREAIVWLSECFLWRQNRFPENHQSRLASQHALAGAYQANGQVKEAVELLEHVVAIEKEVLAEDHPDRLASQHALAGAYEANGQVKEAVELLEHVVAIEKEVLAEDHPSRLASQHALAGAYEANGQVKGAVELLEHVVAIRKEVLAEDHPSRLASQHALAGVYQADGQVEEAVKLLEQVVAIAKEVLAEDHPCRLVSQHALAGAYEANGQVTVVCKTLRVGSR
ncbi:hypothetical protein MMC21_007606 [Puttea exsequens]|nr:hypothetical protein [Puttea exsequens]